MSALQAEPSRAQSGLNGSTALVDYENHEK